MWAAGLVIYSGSEYGIMYVIATACLLMMVGIVIFSPVWIISALLNYACCVFLDRFFAHFFRFDIIILGGLWGGAIALFFSSILREVEASVLIVAIVGFVIGSVAGLFAGRLAPKRSDAPPTDKPDPR